MSENLSYWYSQNSSAGYGSELPVQAISNKKKNKAWKEATMDALERIGIVQLQSNLKYKDFYRMIEGKLSHLELSQVIPQLSELESTLDGIDIPSFLKHYDLIGVIINALVGEYMGNTDKFNIRNDDELAENEFKRAKTDLFRNFVKDEFEKELNLKLLKEGINPDPSIIENIEDPEQREQYIQFIQQRKEALTPPEIEEFMRSKWFTQIMKWAEHTLERDKARFYLDELDTQNLIDFLLTGRCFRHFIISYDYYKPEVWSPLNTFFSQDIDTKYVQDGEYVGRIHFYTGSQVINKYGYLLSKVQKENILGGNKTFTKGTEGTYNINKVLDKHFGETHIVPHKQYYDYNFMLDLQDQFGIPLAEKTTYNKDGSENTTPSFLPDYKNKLGRGSRIAQQLREDLELRSDLLQVTEVYWVSYKKIGYLTYQTDKGLLTEEIVTEDILDDFLKELGIKQVSNKSLQEVEGGSVESNTIVWDYMPEVWQGVKINGTNYNTDKAIYVKVEPMEVQMKGDSNIYDIILPVSGMIDHSLAMKMQPAQVGYNVAMNSLYNLLEKEIGLFFIFDINFLPSEYKDWGNTEETLVHFRNLVKDTGLLPVDASKQNIRDGGGFNQFAVQNLSFSAQIADRMQISEFYKARAFEQVGFNPQRLGSPVKYETAEGVRQSQDASYAQTEIYFQKFSGFKKRALEMHLNIAQFCQTSYKDISVNYTLSDGTRAALAPFDDPYFPLRKLGVLPESNSKDRKTLELFQSYLLSTNTMGEDELSLAKFLNSDTMVGIIEVARSERLKREQQQQGEQQQQMAALSQQAQIEEQKEIAKWKRSEYSNQRDRENNIDVKRIDALGRAADSNAELKSLEFINKEADLALKKEAQASKDILAYKEQQRKETKDVNDHKLRMEELKAKVLETKSKIERTKADKYIAEINKN